MIRRLILAATATAALVFASAAAHAYGPQRVALMDRAIWPEPLNTPAAFDRASRAEVLVFAAALQRLGGKDAEALKEELGLKSADTDAVRKISGRLMGVLLDNYASASRSCTQAEPFCAPAANADELAAAGRNLPGTLPQPYWQWLAESQRFHRLYAMEVVRLAALSPTISSEIETYGPVELTGLERPDRHFQFSFDDGPTGQGGTTDSLLPVLTANGIHAPFYMLGEKLAARVKKDGAATLRGLYQGQCPAMHGWEHKSHQKWAEWQSSVIRSRDLGRDTFGEAFRPWFRPPYGQRGADSGAFFAANGITVALWNIDSQDWNKEVSPQLAADRVLTLMLVWRRGTILFHDVHAKAATAVPAVVQSVRGAGVVWEDCRRP
ncbi:MAG: polysaccharide deacetylase family protein [Bacteroidales bacterium]